jgi:large subunit ribosomal protein L1
MAQTKKELFEQAKDLGIEVDEKAKVADIKALIAAHDSAPAAGEAVEAAKQEAEAITEKRSIEAEPTVAKAGKRSAKSLQAAEAKREKETRKQTDEVTEKPKPAAKPARSRLERRGKHFRKSAEAIEAGKQYSLEQAIELAQKTSHVKFDATVELHVNLGVDPRHADQNIRDNLVLPAGTGKTVKIAVLTDDAAAAKKAGADLAGTDDIFVELDKGNINFDILIATPAQMTKLGKYARVLGPRGLMPNPKSGTVTPDVEKAVAEAKAGRVEYRVDSTGIVHLGVGKVSFTRAQLLQNVQAVMASLKTNKPGSVKGNYIKAVHLTTSMGPSVPVDPANVG